LPGNRLFSSKRIRSFRSRAVLANESDPPNESAADLPSWHSVVYYKSLRWSQRTTIRIDRRPACPEKSMSSEPDQPDQEVEFVRHPLGLPPGSVRAVLALMIASMFWLLLALPDRYEERVPLFLYVLLGMIMLFFGAHGHTIGHHITGHSPLYLPRGILRGLLILGTAAQIGWLYYYHYDRLETRLTPDKNHLDQWPMLLISAFGGFALGYVVRKGPWRKSPGFQDILASISLLAMLGLVAETILIVFVNPSLETQLHLATWEAGLSAVIAFYFGARS
jgi:hypothetical protein